MGRYYLCELNNRTYRESDTQKEIYRTPYIPEYPVNFHEILRRDLFYWHEETMKILASYNIVKIHINIKQSLQHLIINLIFHLL